MGHIDHDIELLRQRIDAQRTLTRTHWVLLRHEFKETAEKTRGKLQFGKRLGSLVTGTVNFIKLFRGGGQPAGKRTWWRQIIALTGVASSAITLVRWMKRRRTV